MATVNPKQIDILYYFDDQNSYELNNVKKIYIKIGENDNETELTKDEENGFTLNNDVIEIKKVRLKNDLKTKLTTLFTLAAGGAPTPFQFQQQEGGGSRRRKRRQRRRRAGKKTARVRDFIII